MDQLAVANFGRTLAALLGAARIRTGELVSRDFERQFARRPRPCACRNWGDRAPYVSCDAGLRARASRFLAERISSAETAGVVHQTNTTSVSP